MAKWKLAVQHCVEHDTYGPDIYCWTCFSRYTVEAFGSHVQQSTCVYFIAAHACNAEINDLHEEVFLEVFVLEENIFKFEIAVNNTPTMTIKHGLYDLQQNVSGNLLVDPVLFLDVVQQLSTHGCFHYHDELLSLDERVEKLYDVFVYQSF